MHRRRCRRRLVSTQSPSGGEDLSGEAEEEEEGSRSRPPAAPLAASASAFDARARSTPHRPIMGMGPGLASIAMGGEMGRWASALQNSRAGEREPPASERCTASFFLPLTPRYPAHTPRTTGGGGQPGPGWIGPPSLQGGPSHPKQAAGRIDPRPPARPPRITSPRGIHIEAAAAAALSWSSSPPRRRRRRSSKQLHPQRRSTFSRSGAGESCVGRARVRCDAVRCNQPIDDALTYLLPLPCTTPAGTRPTTTTTTTQDTAAHPHRPWVCPSSTGGSRSAT